MSLVASRALLITGPAGRIQVLVDEPAGDVVGSAVIGHPHPLFGGTMENKVVQTLARAFTLSGWRSVRFNFRGVGLSDGKHDDGRGEVEDMLAVVQEMTPAGPLAVAGFSFGAYIAVAAAQKLAVSRDIAAMTLVGLATSRFRVPAIAEALAPQTLLIHGEQDDTVPLASVLEWARPQTLPITVIPGGGHFFHGQLPLLRRLVQKHLR